MRVDHSDYSEVYLLFNLVSGSQEAGLGTFLYSLALLGSEVRTSLSLGWFTQLRDSHVTDASSLMP